MIPLIRITSLPPQKLVEHWLLRRYGSRAPDCISKYIYKMLNKQQSLGSAVLGKTGASSITSGTPTGQVQKHVGEEAGCSREAVQQ